MKVRAIIQARMMSSKMRGRSLMSVNEIPLLFRVISSIKTIKVIDEIVIATTDMITDDPIESAVKSLGLKCFRGDALNVLNRFIMASNDMDEHDVIVRFTADNLLYDAEITEKAFIRHINFSADYTYIKGLSHIVPEFINVGALRVSNELVRDNFDKEHVTPYFRKNQDAFNIQPLDNNFEGLRPDLDGLLTINTLDQLERMELLLKSLEYDQKKISITHIYEYLDTQNIKPTHRRLTINLDGTNVGEGYPTYVIAEIGQNHNGDIRLAKKLIDMAVDCGANAVKFQKRDIPSELTKAAYERPYENSNSFGKTYGEHRRFLEFNESQHRELKEYATANNITYFCTPCDILSVRMLERIDCPFYKIASRDLTNLPLLEALGKTGKPVIISTGMADFEDIDNGIRALGYDKKKLIILQCTSQYPCAIENVNLKAMETLKQKYGLVTGFSDHTSGIVISTAASILGASLIEKHITLDRTMRGTDQAGSLERSGLSKLIDYIRACELSIGDGIKAINPSTEVAKIKLARSITSNTAIKKGDRLTEDMICLKSPGDGIKWINKGIILGKKAKRNIDPDVTLRVIDFD